jgi:hypothetical protein
MPAWLQTGIINNVIIRKRFTSLPGYHFKSYNVFKNEQFNYYKTLSLSANRQALFHFQLSIICIHKILSRFFFPILLLPLYLSVKPMV